MQQSGVSIRVNSDANGAAAPTARPLSMAAPGALRGTAVLTLQTHLAQRLVTGRQATLDRPGVVGLLGFANLMRPIWHGALREDPYADWWLLKVEAALTRAEQLLCELKAAVDLRLATIDGLVIALAASVQPVDLPLAFHTPYAFLGARVISRYDSAVCAILTARHVGILTRNGADELLSRAGRSVRRSFVAGRGYWPIGVTREDLVTDTTLAVAAVKRMGTVPADVLAGTRRALHAPAVVRCRTRRASEAILSAPVAEEPIVIDRIAPRTVNARSTSSPPDPGTE